MIPANELALAIELRGESCCWKRIAVGLGVDDVALRYAVKNALRDGLHDARISTPYWAVVAAQNMRADGLGWQSIAVHLGVPLVPLRERYYRLRKGKRPCP